MIYLDVSAIVKLVLDEPETDALRAFLEGHLERVTSELASIEVLRAVRRSSVVEASLSRAIQVINDLDLVFLSDAIRTRAARLEPSSLRTLDAVHVATALDMASDLVAFVTYDARQGAAARDAELKVVAPGS